MAGEVNTDPAGFKWKAGVTGKVNTSYAFGYAGDAFVARVIGGPFSTYMIWLNGASTEYLPHIAVDASNAVYVVTDSLSVPEANPAANPFPWSSAAFKSSTTPLGFHQTAVTKLNEFGSLVFSAVISGGAGAEGHDVGIVPGCQADCAIYAGGVVSGTMATTTVLGPAFGYDSFVAKVNPSGASLDYLTRFEPDWLQALAVDAGGRVHTAGYSWQDDGSALPCTEKLTSPLTGDDVFVATLDAEGQRLDSCAWFGTVWHDWANAIAVDWLGDTYVTGQALREGLPVSGNAYQKQGFEDAFITKLTSGAGGDTTSMQFALSAFRAAEDSGKAVITVTRRGQLANTSTVTFATSAGTAQPGVDYTETNVTKTFGPGETALAIEVPLLDDNLTEPDQTVHLNLTGSSGGSLGSPSAATLTIGDDDTTVHTLSIHDRVLPTGPVWHASADVPWVQFSATDGTGPSTITVTVSAAGLSPGIYPGRITVTGDTGDSPQSVPVTLRVTAQ